MRLIMVWFATLLVGTTLGCERFESPTEAQCEAALKNGLSSTWARRRMQNRRTERSPAFAAGQRGLEGEDDSSRLLGLQADGRIQARLSTCQNDWSVHVTNCYTAGKTEADLSACKTWPWDDAPRELPQ